MYKETGHHFSMRIHICIINWHCTPIHLFFHLQLIKPTSDLIKKIYYIDTGGPQLVRTLCPHTANVYRQRTDKLLFLYAIITHENV